jgi:hypothetical protein
MVENYTHLEWLWKRDGLRDEDVIANGAGCASARPAWHVWKPPLAGCTCAQAATEVPKRKAQKISLGCSVPSRTQRL